MRSSGVDRMRRESADAPPAINIAIPMKKAMKGKTNSAKPSSL